MRSVDVLVVGLGPAGAAAAAAAARGGVRVLGVDKRRAVGLPVQCAEFIPRPLGRQARAAGVLRQAIEGMLSVLPSGAAVHTEFPGLMIDRAAFDQALAEEARGAGAELALATQLVRLDAGHRQATLRSAAGEETLAYRLLVAADGPHSMVARGLGLGNLEVVQTRQYTVPLNAAYRDTDIWLSPDYPGGYAWLFPKGQLANLGLGADKRLRSDLKSPLDALHCRLVAEGRVGEEIVCRTGGGIPVGGLRPSLVVGKVLFVGDAAGFTHPITGAGIAAAVISGEGAGRAAADHLGGAAHALADFEEDMRDQFETSLTRAAARRRQMLAGWLAADARRDAFHRRGWIAFPEYFQPDFSPLRAGS